MELAQLNQSIVEEIQISGLYKGKTAKIYNIMGRRAGFTSTSAFNDLKEYDNAVADIPTYSNATVDIISSSVNDIAITGTGIRTVDILYLDINNNIQITTASLNGTTLVTSVITGVNAILGMEAASVGSLGFADGNIRLRLNGGTTEIEQISAKGNKSITAYFKIPAGYSGYVFGFDGFAVNNDQDLRLSATVCTFTGVLEPIYHFLDLKYIALNTNASGSNKPPFLKLPPLTQIKVSTMSGGTAGTVRCGATFILIIIQI